MENNWKEVKLGEFIKVKHGFAFPGTHITDQETDQILVTPGNFHIGGGFKNNKFKYFNSKDYPESYILKENDIVVTMTDLSKESDTLGYGAKIPRNNKVKFLHNQRVGLVEFKDEKEIHNDFVYWVLRTRSYQGYVVGSASGTSIMHTSPSRIEDYDFFLPPLPEQKAIASVLSSLDDKIDLLHQQNQTLEALAETLFRQWFIEEAKEDWEEGKLGDAIEIFDSQRIPLSNMERDKKKDGTLYPYYGAAKIMDYINDYIFDGEYILFAEDGTVQTTEGYPVLQYAIGKFWVNNHTHVIKAKAPYNNFFLLNYLRKKNIELYITGAVQPKINQANLKSIDFPKFPLDKVSEFIKLTNQYFDKINLNNTQIQTLTQLRDTLLPKLMSGEVKVKN